MKRAVIYARVSTDEQKEKGYSLPSQVEACQKYADTHGLNVIAKISDDYTGTLLDRPGLDQVRAMMDRREVDAVIVLASDRWTRKLAHSLILREEMMTAGIELHYVNRGKSENTPEGELMDNIEGVFNQYWREKIIEGGRRGKNAKAKQNKMIMAGSPPFGYAKEGHGRDAKLVINEQEAHVVRDMFKWYVFGDGEGPMSIRTIATKLEECGISSPNHRSCSVGHWMPGTINVMLNNELYAGKAYHGKTRIINKQRVVQPREKWIEIDVPELAIISRDVFKAVKVRAKRNKELAKRNRKFTYLLSGYMRCGYCGCATTGMTFVKNGNQYPRYRCSKHWGKFKDDECPNVSRAVGTDKVDNAVWSWLVSLLKDEQALRDGIREMQARSEQELEPKQKRLEMVKELVEQRTKAVERLISDLGEEDNETIRDALKSKLKAIGREVESLQQEMKQIGSELAQSEIMPGLEEQVLEIAAEIREELDEPDYETKRFILNRLNVSVVYNTSDTARWLDVKCGIAAEAKKLCLTSQNGMLVTTVTQYCDILDQNQ
jgi:site-specific DNA recombinase